MNRLRLMQKMTVRLSRSYMASNSNILKLKNRGMLQAIFPEERNYELEKLLTSSPQTFYCGFDPTADSLHLGNLLSIMVLLHCQRAGHKPIAVVGGATALIGDPSDKVTDRPALRPDIVEGNIKGIRRDLKTIFTNYNNLFHNPAEKELPELRIFNNADWYKKLNVIEFFCTTGRFLRMGDMLSKKNIKKRLESDEGLNLTEFLYQVFQAFDWLHLFHKHACNIQLGGSDQMGNIMSGFDLLGKFFKGQFFGITTPLITAPNGDKLGKSDGNALWLNPEKTSAFELYQFFIRLPDSEVEKYLKLFTFFSETELLSIMAKQKTEPSSRHAHKTLAREVVKLVHGEEGLKSAMTCTDALYSMSPQKLSSLSRKEVKDIFKGAPIREFHFEPGMTAMDVAMKAGCFKKEGVAEEIMRAGGFHINTIKVTEPDCALIPGQHILLNNLTIIKTGKRTHHIVQWQGMEHEKGLFEEMHRDKKL